MKLVWDKTEKRLYETGIDRGILFLYSSGKYSEGKPWNGLTAVNENPSGAEPTALYADNIKYLNLMSAEELGLSIEAYSYPEEFMSCLGKLNIIPGVSITQQDRKYFGFSYRTITGNDTKGDDFGYKIHLVFKCLATPSETDYETVNDSPDVVNYSWDIEANPIYVDEDTETASIILDSTKFKEAGLMNVFRAIEDVLYGTDDTKSNLPQVSEIDEIFQKHMNLLDSSGHIIMDNNGDAIESFVRY